MIREFVPDMVKRNEGHVVAVASVAGFGGITNASMYVATKHGVVGKFQNTVSLSSLSFVHSTLIAAGINQM